MIYFNLDCNRNTSTNETPTSRTSIFITISALDSVALECSVEFIHLSNSFERKTVYASLHTTTARKINYLLFAHTHLSSTAQF